MPAVQFKRMNWFQKVPLWKYNEAWRQHHAAATGKFLDNTAAAVNSFTAAAINQIDGTAEISAQAAVDRIEAAVKAKAARSLDAHLVDLFA